MRQYASPAALSAVIDARLRAYAARVGAQVMVVRRQAALGRLMLRLMKVAPGQWALKGGLALSAGLDDTRAPHHHRGRDRRRKCSSANRSQAVSADPFWPRSSYRW